MGFVTGITNGIDSITRYVNFLSMGLFFFIMIVGIVGVVSRLFGIALISGIVNFSELLLVMAIYFGIAHTQKVRKHVAMQLFVLGLTGRKRRILDIINLVIITSILSIVVITCWDYTINSFNIKESMHGAPFYPIYPAKFALAVGMSTLWAQVLADMIRGFISRRTS